ncbi:MAG: transporter [Terriglobia bacterium]|nr:MAG: transporter [Terriglobia bacterium]
MEKHRPAHLIRILTLSVIIFNVSGNYFLDVGMRSIGQIVSLSPLDYMRVFANPWIVLGVALLSIWLICQLSLFSWADLTFVLPITSVSYVLIALLGAILLNEHVSAARWGGVTLIVTGVAVVSRTRPRTAPEFEEDR